jgi:hypothetical protein
MNGLRVKLNRGFWLGGLLACAGLMAVGCSSFVGRADPSDPLAYDPVNYVKVMENGVTNYRLSEQGKKVMADKEAGVVKQKKKKWWHLW